MSVRAVVTDIEGTTSSLRFVHDVLFPYAARELPAFVRDGSEHPRVAALLDDIRSTSGEFDASVDRIIEILLQWIAEDRKAGPLKALQGMVWRQGYENGDFTGHVYPDAADRLRRWHLRGIRLFVYSSGSVDAQKLLFGHSELGDLRPLFDGYFDTGIGHKKEQASYEAIQAAIGLSAPGILFLSDVIEELDAAAAAGMRTTQLVRSEDLPTGDHPTAKSFDDVIIE